ncbi:hypothetical protein ACN079_10190 [Pseudomonas sp. ABY48]|uniref:hypothetical protein n=1 Tax=Pseudomonas sp. ABY48 TaxID=3402865 RepID=UPI003B4325BF
MLVNESISEVRFRSFYMAGNLVCELLVLFFLMSKSGWVSLTVSEGVSKFTSLGTAPDLLDLAEISDDFAYPIGLLTGLDKYLGLEVLAVYEYRVDGLNEGCIGVYFDFGDCGLSIVECDGCMAVIEDVQRYPDDKVSLFRVSV